MQIILNGRELLREGRKWSSPAVCTFQQAHKYLAQGEEIVYKVVYKRQNPSALTALKLVIKCGYKLVINYLLLLSYQAVEWWMKSHVNSTKCHTQAKLLLSKIELLLGTSWEQMGNKQQVPSCSCVSVQSFHS